MPFINGVYVPKENQDPLENASRRELLHETTPVGEKAKKNARRFKRRMSVFNRVRVVLTVLVCIGLAGMLLGIGAGSATITLVSLAFATVLSAAYYIFVTR